MYPATKVAHAKAKVKVASYAALEAHSYSRVAQLQWTSRSTEWIMTMTVDIRDTRAAESAGSGSTQEESVGTYAAMALQRHAHTAGQRHRWPMRRGITRAGKPSATAEENIHYSK